MGGRTTCTCILRDAVSLFLDVTECVQCMFYKSDLFVLTVSLMQYQVKAP